MAKKLTIVKFPTTDEQSELIRELSELKPESSGLVSLTEVLRQGIVSARKNDVTWEKIAKFLSEKTETEITAEALSQAFQSSEREKKNKGRLGEEPTYAQLRSKYHMALTLLAESGISEEEFEKKFVESRKKRKSSGQISDSDDCK